MRSNRPQTSSPYGIMMSTTRKDATYSLEQVLPRLRGGHKLFRKGWNGQGQFIYIRPEITQVIGESPETQMLIGHYAEGVTITYSETIYMRFANGEFGEWSPTGEDILARDWNILI